MTKERARALIPILQAIIDEKQTQHRYDHWPPGKWHDTEVLEFHLNDRVSWRIKPEPREWWIVKRAEYPRPVVYDFKPVPVVGAEIIHVREIDP